MGFGVERATAMDRERLLAAMRAGQHLIVPGETAARVWRVQWNASLRVEGIEWMSAPVSALPSWMAAQWSGLVADGVEERLLLGPLQEHSLWREIIASGPAMETLQAPDALADLAMDAWSRAVHFGAEAEVRRSAGTRDTQTFAAWMGAFTQACARGGMLSRARLAAALGEHAAAGRLLPADLLLVGFEEQDPSVRTLLTALQAAGFRLEFAQVTHDSPPTTVHVVEASSPEDERVAAARWVRDVLRAGAEGTRVALISPSIASEGAELEAVLLATLTPELEDVAADMSSVPWTFSRPASLGDTAIAVTALDLLRWSVGPLPLERVSALLRSPYVGTADSLGLRSEFDAFQLREQQMLRPEVSLTQVAALAEREAWRALGAWAGPMLMGAIGLKDADSRSYGEWMEFARGWLRRAAWPGTRAMNGQDFADVEAWEHALDAVATLDFNGARVGWDTALRALERNVRRAGRGTVAGDASVFILAPEDAAGCAFDALTLLHANDTTWPLMTGAHPLLARSLQRTHAMPGGDVAADTVRAAAWLERTAAAVPKALIVHAAADANGPLRVAPLVAARDWPRLRAADAFPAAGDRLPVALEKELDRAVLPVPASRHVRGGAKVLQLQAQCGFRAFAEIRLFAREPQSGSLGMDARETGSFLHRALDLLWREVKTDAVWRLKTDAEREEALTAAVRAALPRADHGAPWEGAYVAVQADRLRALLAKWMRVEMQRGPFRVAAEEKKMTVGVGPLTLDLRVDRMDEVPMPDGKVGTVLVDYKSGARPGVKDWSGERPDDPQLPLYALLPEAESLQGMAFAKVLTREKDRKWIGFAESPEIFPQMAKMEFGSLAEHVAAWRAVLTTLAQQFYDGAATVQPKVYPETCVHCAQRLLCRLDRIALQARADTADGGESA